MAQIEMSGRLEPARGVETRSHLMGQALLMNQAVGTRRSDRLFVKILSVELSTFEAGYFGTDQRGAALEILGAIFRPARELRVMGEEHLQMARQCLGRFDAWVI